MLGTPSSIARNVTIFVLGPWVSVGVQPMAPAGETVRPLGPETSSIATLFGGASVSVALAFTLSAVNSSIV